MDINKLLEGFKVGRISKKEVLDEINKSSFSNIGAANIDYDREKRRGYPEVVYCRDKTPEDVKKIFSDMLGKGKKALGTKATKKHYEACKDLNLKYDKVSGLIYTEVVGSEKKGKVAVICAGTSDKHIAEEAALTLEFFGSNVVRKYDYGIAGLNRLFAIIDEIEECNVIVVVAGMDGALPTAVSGLVSKPVIAVPTSVGYGASFNGLAALLTMLNSCSPGITVVNIDNGFGAGYSANIINMQSEGGR
ncbi:MAG: nickel pincer cofactor biosynthesis protein LarB [Nanoarchaeota archaeon]